jgi:hypothetical protein
MDRASLARRAAATATQVLRDHSITSLPVDPVALAEKVGITVQAKDAEGCSGMLIKQGDNFGILYSTHIDSKGFQNFSVAHELGHYFLEGHPEALLRTGVHKSQANFVSDDPYEVEADFFASNLLMPERLFTDAAARAGKGLPAIEGLSRLCGTSLTATANRYAGCTGEVVAVVFSIGRRVKWAIMSPALLEIAGSNRIDRDDLVPPKGPTDWFNEDQGRVRAAGRHEGTSDLQDWIGGRHSVELAEEIAGLGGYGRTMTVLSANGVVDVEELEEEADVIESWRPRFRR